MEETALEEGIITNNDPLDYTYGGFWIRVGATLIDTLALLPLLGLNLAALYLWKQLWLVLLVNLVSVAYKPFMEFKYGATLGKMAVKLKVINREGENISINQTLLRSSPWLVNGLFSLYVIVQLALLPEYQEVEGYTALTQLQTTVTPIAAQMVVSLAFLLVVVWVAFQKQKRGLHDLLADTFVIQTDK